MAQVIWADNQGRNLDFLSMLRPVDPASDIAERLSRAGLSQAELARYMGLDASSLSKTIKGQRQLKAVEMVKIEEFFATHGGTTTDQRRLVDSPATRMSPGRKLPVYGYAAPGGAERVQLSDGRVIDWIDPPPFWNGIGELIGVRIIGVSMEPRLFEGEMVIAQLNMPPARGRDCLIEFHDGSGLVKTYTTQRDGMVFCREWNPDREVAIPGAQVKALHAVIWRR